jgi:hypothetical protein
MVGFWYSAVNVKSEQMRAWISNSRSWRDAGEKLSWKPEILGFRLVFYQETTNYT